MCCYDFTETITIVLVLLLCILQPVDRSMPNRSALTSTRTFELVVLLVAGFITTTIEAQNCDPQPANFESRSTQYQQWAGLFAAGLNGELVGLHAVTFHPARLTFTDADGNLNISSSLIGPEDEISPLTNPTSIVADQKEEGCYFIVDPPNVYRLNTSATVNVVTLYLEVVDPGKTTASTQFSLLATAETLFVVDTSRYCIREQTTRNRLPPFVGTCGIQGSSFTNHGANKLSVSLMGPTAMSAGSDDYVYIVDGYDILRYMTSPLTDVEKVFEFAPGSELYGRLPITQFLENHVTSDNGQLLIAFHRGCDVGVLNRAAANLSIAADPNPAAAYCNRISGASSFMLLVDDPLAILVGLDRDVHPFVHIPSCMLTNLISVEEFERRSSTSTPAAAASTSSGSGGTPSSPSVAEASPVLIATVVLAIILVGALLLCGVARYRRSLRNKQSQQVEKEDDPANGSEGGSSPGPSKPSNRSSAKSSGTVQVDIDGTLTDSSAEERDTVAYARRGTVTSRLYVPKDHGTDLEKELIQGKKYHKLSYLGRGANGTVYSVLLGDCVVVAKKE